MFPLLVFLFTLYSAISLSSWFLRTDGSLSALGSCRHFFAWTFLHICHEGSDRFSHIFLRDTSLLLCFRGSELEVLSSSESAKEIAGKHPLLMCHGTSELVKRLN